MKGVFARNIHVMSGYEINTPADIGEAVNSLDLDKIAEVRTVHSKFNWAIGVTEAYENIDWIIEGAWGDVLLPTGDNSFELFRWQDIMFVESEGRFEQYRDW